MSENQTIFDTLNSNIPNNEKRIRLESYLRKQLEVKNSNPDHADTIAYDIAGLLSTMFVKSLSEEDPYLRVLHLAGQLELPERHRGNATWMQMEELIDSLS